LSYVGIGMLGGLAAIALAEVASVVFKAVIR
jgi:hypothetical protein